MKHKYGVDLYVSDANARDGINDTLELWFIEGGFSAFLTSARLREKGLESIRIVQRAGDVARHRKRRAERKRCGCEFFIK